MSPPAASSDRTRTLLVLTALLAGGLLAGALGGCAYSTRPAAASLSSIAPMADSDARSAVEHWQAKLGRYVTDEGGGDPSVLAHLPAQRSPAVLRPGRIVFSALDVFATVPERDGYDVSGLLVGKATGAATPTYVFIVGTVERGNYRPLAVADVRIAVMSIRDGAMSWNAGFSDGTALARYREHADPSAAARFPADRDQFRLVDCPAAVCVEETVSGARWTLPLGVAAERSAARP
jgi:hypothetical protein